MCERRRNADGALIDLSVCVECQNYTDTDDASEIGGDSLCVSCADNYCECHGCNGRISNDDSRTDEDGDHFCDSCYTDQYTTCDACDCELYRESACSGPGGYGEYCESCHDERLSNCDECGDTCDRDDLDDDYRCPGCSHQSDRITVSPVVNPGYLPSRNFAVEIECYNSSEARDELSDDGWECCRDGSLSEGGMEFCSGPIGGQDAIDMIERASATLREAGATVDQTCGLHLHIDATGESADAVARFVRLAKRLELWSKTVVPASRRGAHYCDDLPAQAERVLDWDSLERCVYNGRPSFGAKKEKYNEARYRWVNAHSWFYRGTVEIRLHSGTTDSAKILAWARFWLAAFEFAKRSTIAEIDAVRADELAGFALIEQLGLPVALAGYFAGRANKFATVAA